MNSFNMNDLGHCLAALMMGDPDFDKEQAVFGGNYHDTVSWGKDVVFEAGTAEEKFHVNTSALARMLYEWFDISPKDNDRFDEYVQSLKENN